MTEVLRHHQVAEPRANMKRVVVIGGGITGLAAAHRLVERGKERALGLEVILLEASERLGGVLQTDHHDGFLLERGPDSFISEKPETIDLAKRLGLESHLIGTNKTHRRSFIVRDGTLRSVPEGFYLLAPARLRPFMTSNILSWGGKARMVLDLLLPRGQKNGSADESLAEFVRRRFGREALERVAQPLVGGIYTADPEKLSLRATMPRFLEMERLDRSVICALRKADRSPTPGSLTAQRPWGGTVRGPASKQGVSGARYSLFLSFDRGMQMLIDRLSDRLPHGTVRLKNGVESIKFDSGSGNWTINQRARESFCADAVLIALPAYTAANLLRESDSNLASELDRIQYESTATINLAYKRSDIPHLLGGFGFVVPFIEHRSIIACTFSSVKFPGRAPEGFALLRVFVGGALQPEMFALDVGEIVHRVLADLRTLLRIEQAPLFTQVAKWARSMPQYEVGHLDRVKKIEERARQLPNLKLAGNAYRGAGISDCIRGGENAAEEILGRA